MKKFLSLTLLSLFLINSIEAVCKIQDFKRDNPEDYELMQKYVITGTACLKATEVKIKDDIATLKEDNVVLTYNAVDDRSFWSKHKWHLLTLGVGVVIGLVLR